jgi:hypothetical protein
VVERLAGQAVMTTVAVLSIVHLGVEGSLGDRGGLVASAIVVLLLVGWGAVRLARRVGRRFVPGARAARFRRDAREALTGSTAPLQWLSAAAVVTTYVGVYVVAARAVGVVTPIGNLAPLVAPVLMTMLIPVTVAGWGVREGAAALLWGAAGLTAEDGVAISVAYGLIVLVASLPGVGVLMRPSPGGRDRTGRPDPTGSDDSEGEGPPTGRRSPEG